MLAQLEVTHLVYMVHIAGVRAEGDLHPFSHHSVDHPDAGNSAAIPVVVRVEDQRPERRVFLSPWRRHPRDDGLEQLGDSGPLLG